MGSDPNGYVGVHVEHRWRARPGEGPGRTQVRGRAAAPR